MKHAIYFAPLLAALMLTAPANGQETQTEKNFSGEVRLGFESTTGNTDTQSLAGAVSAKYLRGKWVYSGRISGSGRQDNGINAEEQYHSELKAERHYGEKNYLYGQILYDRDRF
ncbi:MAG: DUF481 domain-containing protein, partial [Gammaproteobacteria bacterium]